MSECSGNNPYSPGGPYGPGNPYCGNCNVPANPNAPTDAGCVPDTSDPCAVKDLQTDPCYNGICDQRYENLPPTVRMRLTGVDGQCLYQFPHSVGFVVSDKRGQFITNRPCIDMPFLKSFIRDSEGNLVEDSNGDPVEGAVPRFDSIVVSDNCGCQNRVQGINGTRQQMIWDSNGFIFEQVPIVENNPLLDPLEVPVVDQGCPEVLIAALIPSCKKVPNDCGGEKTVRGYKIGGVRNTGVPIGTMSIWPGTVENIPGGYMLADGTTLDRDEFPELFAILGYGWGGVGSDFNLPDMRGLVPRGVDNGEGRDPDAADRIEIAPGGNVGDKVGSLQGDTMQCFGLGTYQRYQVAGIGIKQSTAGSSTTVAKFSNQYTATNIEFVDTGCGDPRFSQETRPKNVYVNYIIRSGCPPIEEVI